MYCVHLQLCSLDAARVVALTPKSACLVGTAIETNINGRFKLTLHKAATLEPKLQNLDFGLLENANEYVVHGLTVKVLLTALTEATEAPMVFVCTDCSQLMQCSLVQQLP